MNISYKLKNSKNNQKKLLQNINEIYPLDNEIYVVNGNSNSSNNNIRNNDIIIPSLECLSNCIHLLSIISSSSSSSSSSVLLVLSSCLHNILDYNNLPYSYQKIMKSYLLESPIISTIIFYNEYLKEICYNNNSHNNNHKYNTESINEYNLRLFIDSCKYLNKNNKIQVITIDYDDKLYDICKNNNISVITLTDYYERNMLSSSSLSLLSKLKIDIDETLINRNQKKESNNSHCNNCLYSFKQYISNTDIRKGLASGILLKGIIHVKKFTSNQAEVEIHGNSDHNNILIDGITDLNRAIDGDEVIIRVNPTSKWKVPRQINSYLDKEGDDKFNNNQNDNIKLEERTIPTASVLSIIKRAMNEIIAIVPSNNYNNNNTTNNDNILVIPIDKRIPKIRVRIRNWERLQGHKIIVIIDDWSITSNYPNGHYNKVIGPCGDLETEIDSLLLKNSIFPRPFSTKAIACLPTTTNKPNNNDKKVWFDSGWIMPEDEIFNGSRLDMRTTRRVFSVDPEGCQDIDDAMSVEWIRPGVIEIAISIADVCAFVPHLSALDIEAQNRGTTVYLIDRRIDMLPSLLSSDIASLHGNKDRYAFTVKFTANVYHANRSIVTEDKDPMKLDECNDIIFELSEDAWVGRTAIRSVAAMTYEQAHNLIHNKNPNTHSNNVPPGQAGGFIPGSLHQALKKDLRLLTVFSRFLKKRRQVNGSFDLHSTAELKFQTDVEGNPITIKQKEDLEIHETIAELMIVTNSKVAEIIHHHHTSQGGLVRVHMPPSHENFEQLKDMFKILGNNIDHNNLNNHYHYNYILIRIESTIIIIGSR